MDYWTLKKKAIIGSMQSGKTAETEGYPLKLENAIKGNMKDYRIWGNKKGKNLLKATDVYKNAANYQKLTEDGRNCIRFVDNKGFKCYYPFKKNTRYTVSFDCKITTRATNNTIKSMLFQFFYGKSATANDEDAVFIQDSQKNEWIHIEFTSRQDINLSAVGITACNFVHWCYIDIDTFQIEEGTTATEYEPYQENDGLGAFSGNIDVVNSGKNLLKATDVYKGASDYQELVEDGRNCIRFVDNARVEYKYPFKENTQYTVSFDCKITTRATNNALKSMFFRFFYTDGSADNAHIIYVEDNQKDKWISVKLTSTKGKIISAIGISACNFVHYCYIDVNTFQFEEGTEATPYEAVREPTTTTIDLTGHNSIMPNEYIDFRNGCIVRSDGTEEDIILPKIPLSKGYNILTASDAELEATKMYGKYLKKG